MPQSVEIDHQPQPQMQTSKITIPINPLSSSTSSISSSTTNGNTSMNNKNGQNINTEEFAKLDALLEDLLAEVEQPILLNKDGIVSNWTSTNNNSNGNTNGMNRSLSSNNNNNNNNNSTQSTDEIERSVDWLNEQKERLKTRKELVNSFSSKYADKSTSSTSSSAYPTKYKSKIDYYISNDYNNNKPNGVTTTTNGSTTTSNGIHAINQAKYGYVPQENHHHNHNQSLHLNDQSLNGLSCGGTSFDQSFIVNNKPPVSPNPRLVYSPTPMQQQQQQVVQLPIVSTSFRSLSSNAPLLKNINEIEDENNNNGNMVSCGGDGEFDRFSQRSFRSNAATNTVQRSKYHTVSNDYVECTRPTAPTPVPTYNSNRSGYQSKRALSAPPTEIGKVFLQRMELKSPLTVRQGSVIPFEQRPAILYPDEQQQSQQQQQPLFVTSTTTTTTQPPVTTVTRQFIDNPYNNRGILKSNNYLINQNNPNSNIGVLPQQQQQQPQQFQIVQQQQQQQLVPQTRNVFLNRAYSETPRVAYTNGYETDSGLPTSYNYNNKPVYNTTARLYNNNNNNNVIDSRMGGGGGGVDAGVMNNSYNHGYRTIGPSSSARYQILNDQSGYDTDTGLIKLRHVLDNNRRGITRGSNTTTSNNGLINQQQNLYNRSITPSFSYNSSQPVKIISSQSQNNNNDMRFTSLSPDPMNGGPQIINQQYVLGSYPVVDPITGNISYITNTTTTEFMQPQALPSQTTTQQVNTIQYIDANGNVTTGIPAFITADGNQIIIQEIDPSLMKYNNNNGYVPTTPSPPLQTTQTNSSQPTSLIIHQQVAPSAYQHKQLTNGNKTLTSSSSAAMVNGVKSTSAFEEKIQNSGSLNQLNNKNNKMDTSTTTVSNNNNSSNTNANRIGISTSASNLTSQKQQQQLNTSQSQQINGTNNSKDETRRASSSSLAETNEVLKHHPKSVKASQSYWYKPKISRDEAISLLKDKPPGTFLIRDSNNFPGAYGLALKVDKPPPNVQVKRGTDPANELVRHFLIEPTTKGVRIKGCCNEPIFASLAALVHQHSVTPLALPIKLILPTQDLQNESVNKSTGSVNMNGHSSSTNISSQQQQQQQPQQQQQSFQQQQQVQSNQQQQVVGLTQEARLLLEKGAACNVYFLNTVNVENKNGLEGINIALKNTKAFINKDSSQLLLIQFKVTAQGITLTDLNRKKFLRHHYPVNTVLYCAVDENLTWPQKLDKIAKPRIFGVICKSRVTDSNECHLFVELDPDQPAIAIVDFINRYLIPSKLNLKVS